MRKLLATLGCVVAIGGMTVVAAPAAHAGVGNCTSLYVTTFDDGNNATRPTFHIGYLGCLASDYEICTGRGYESYFDLAGCLID
jgi:hypothetical protein